MEELLRFKAIAFPLSSGRMRLIIPAGWRTPHFNASFSSSFLNSHLQPVLALISHFWLHSVNFGWFWLIFWSLSPIFWLIGLVLFNFFGYCLLFPGYLAFGCQFWSISGHCLQFSRLFGVWMSILGDFGIVLPIFPLVGVSMPKFWWISNQFWLQSVDLFG